MLQCYELSLSDAAVIFVAEIMLFLFYKYHKYSNKSALLWCMAFVVIFYFSINMVTETVTIDEPKHEIGITDVRNMKNLGYAEAFLNQYKLSQMTIGTFFRLIPESVKTWMGENRVWKLYKTCHWFLIYAFALLTSHIWITGISDGDEKRKKLVGNALLFILTALPLSCLLLKVTNYDAGSTYPAILGISMLIAAYKNRDIRLGFCGTIVTAICPMEKFTALPYWVISVILFLIIKCEMEENLKNKILAVVKATAGAFLGAIMLSVGYFVCQYFVQAGFCRAIRLEEIVFSFSHGIYNILFSNFTAVAYRMDIICFIGLFIFCILSALLIDALSNVVLRDKETAAKLYGRLCGLFLILGILGGIVSTFFIPLRIYPYLEIEDGFYSPMSGFDGAIYHFGARTAAGHFLSKICYMFAVVINNLPTPILILVIVAAFLMMIEPKGKTYFYSLILSASLLLLLLYAIAGLPYGARYYSFPIYFIVIVSFLYAEEMIALTRDKKFILMIAVSVFCFEMLLYVPNVSCFSPIWAWRGKEWNESIRVGKWYAGESMFWGDQLAMAGRWISNDIVDRGINYADITVYSHYGCRHWSANPGFRIDVDPKKILFNDTTYIILHKFVLYIEPLPDFITEVKPLYTIKFKGEIGAYIYRADQLAEYRQYFMR